MEDNYKKLNPDLIEDQILTLSNRIRERFPESGLYSVSNQLLKLVRAAKVRADEFSKPNYYLRGSSFFLILMILLGIIYTFSQISFQEQDKITIFHFFEVVESGVNDLVFIAILIFFLSGLESKIKRKKALRAMEELRSIAHVIDMHQLNKDPQLLIAPGPSTTSSPIRYFTAYEMGRYFNYCSEMLALIGKISAFYIENLNDQTVLTAATEIEDLTMGTSNKIWEKILILHISSPAIDPSQKIS